MLPTLSTTHYNVRRSTSRTPVPTPSSFLRTARVAEHSPAVSAGSTVNQAEHGVSAVDIVVHEIIAET
jgi:hypothetical protein